VQYRALREHHRGRPERTAFEMGNRSVMSAKDILFKNVCAVCPKSEAVSLMKDETNA
jgi:hypothetical protein